MALDLNDPVAAHLRTRAASTNPYGVHTTLKTELEHLHAIELPTPFPVGPITVYLADAPGEPLTLIDTGPRTAKARTALEKALALQGYRSADLAQIVITHAHVDHYGLAAELVASSNASILSHAWNVPALGDFHADRQRRTGFYAHLLQQAAVPREVVEVVRGATRDMGRFAQPVTVTECLEEAHILRLAGHDWQILHTPGHAAGLICLYEPHSRTLLSSDHLLADISSNPVVEPPRPGQTERPKSLVLYVASLQRVAALEVNLAMPSHGPAIQDVSGLVTKRLAFHQRRKQQVLVALRNGALTTWAITQALFPNLSPLDTFLAVSEAIGHLDLLEMEERIVGEQADGVISWRVAASTLSA